MNGILIVKLPQENSFELGRDCVKLINVESIIIDFLKRNMLGFQNQLKSDVEWETKICCFCVPTLKQTHLVKKNLEIGFARELFANENLIIMRFCLGIRLVVHVSHMNLKSQYVKLRAAFLVL